MSVFLVSSPSTTTNHNKLIYRTPRTPRAMATGDGPSTAALLAFATAICATETEMVSGGWLESREIHGHPGIQTCGKSTQ